MIARCRTVPKPLAHCRVIRRQPGQELGLRGRSGVSRNQEDRHHGREHEGHARGDHRARRTMSRSDRVIKHSALPAQLAEAVALDSGMHAEALVQSWPGPADLDRLNAYITIILIDVERNAGRPFCDAAQEQFTTSAEADGASTLPRNSGQPITLIVRLAA